MAAQQATAFEKGKLHNLPIIDLTVEIDQLSRQLTSRLNETISRLQLSQLT